MTQALNPAFFGKVVPLAGQRKPPSASRITRLVWPEYDRLPDGRYLIERWMEKGQPLTVCNGLTGKDVIAGKWYSPAECFRLEKKRYVQYEQIAKRSLTYWGSYNPFQQATFYDFLHNKGDGKFQTSTMRRDANAGNWVKACRENVRWNKGTVDGVSVVLPGLKIRGDANAELCEWGLSWRG